MFKKTALQATMPDSRELARLEVTRLRALTSGDETLDVYDEMVVDLQLRSGHSYVLFDGCEQTTYCGQNGETFVFAIYIGDDEPLWLTDLIDLEEGEIPIHGESVYVIVSAPPGQEATAQLAVYSGDSATWDCEKVSPLSDDDLAKLIELIGA